jgi:hypothetical protein
MILLVYITTISETPFYGVLLGSAAIHRGGGHRMQGRCGLKGHFT